MSGARVKLNGTGTRRHLGWLILTHLIAAALGMAVMAILEVRSQSRATVLTGAFYVGLLFSQASLLGLWGGLTLARWWERIIGFALGAVYLGILVKLSVGANELLVDVILAAVLSLVIMSLVRLLDVAVFREQGAPLTQLRMQFSIRHILFLTFLAGIFFAAGRLVQPWLSHHRDYFNDVLVIASTFCVVGVFSGGMTLGTRVPIYYGIVAVIVSGGIGFCVGRIFNYSPDVLTVVGTVESLLVVVSLLYVRYCGYSLRQRPRHATPQAPASEASDRATPDS